MASTTLAPPKSFRGISPRELMSAEAGDAGPPVTVFGQTTRWYTLKAGLPLVVVGPDEAATRHTERDTDPISDSVAGYNRIRFQCPVLASSVPEGTRLALRVLPYIGGAWSYFNAADEGPWLPLHEVAESDGVIIPVLSDWFTIDAEFDQDNIVLEWITYGGDGTGEVIIGNIHVQFSASTRPPTSEIPTPPEIPTTDPLLLADWGVIEDSDGLDLSDASGNGNVLVLGPLAPDGQRPGSVDHPTAGYHFGAGASLKLRYARNATLPWDTGIASDLSDLSIVFYLRISSLPTGDAWIFRLSSTAGGELQIKLTSTGIVRVARGPVGIGIAVDTAALSTSTDYQITVTCGGGALKAYVNAGAPVSASLIGTIPVFTSQPILLWGADNAGFTSAAGLPATIGATLIYDGVLSATQVAAIYAQYRLDYPGLPVP